MHLVRVDGPVGEELRQHGSKESKEGSRSANRDVVPDEQRWKHAASNARNNVDDTDSHCKENENANSDSDTVLVVPAYIGTSGSYSSAYDIQIVALVWVRWARGWAYWLAGGQRRRAARCTSGASNPGARAQLCPTQVLPASAACGKRKYFGVRNRPPPPINLKNNTCPKNKSYIVYQW